jgi:hypothetical protein
MYKIHMTTKTVSFDMPKENHDSLLKACHYADLYKEKNPKAHFAVIDADTGDVMYEPV